MALVIPSDQVSVRGIRTSSIAGVTIKPQQFQYQPTVNQKRVETFDADGFRIPGLPVPIAKDPKLNVGYNVVSPQLVELVMTGVDELYTAAVSFATTDDGTFNFAASSMVIDGQSLAIDPLQDTMQIAFIITDPSTVTFAVV
jgi:hypothetical protein